MAAFVPYPESAVPLFHAASDNKQDNSNSGQQPIGLIGSVYYSRLYETLHRYNIDSEAYCDFPELVFS
jgi:hypothetical protein